MTCDLVRDHLDAYLAGRADPELGASMERHLAGCADCRADRDALVRLRPVLASLPREIPPAEDLWRGISPRLRRPAGRQVRLPLWALIAAGLALVAGTSTLTVTLTRRASPPVAAAFDAAEARYVQAAMDLSSLYARQRDSLAPETRAVLERNLATIERALGEAREALEHDPANPALEAVVLAAYRQKIDFLQRASTLDRGG